MSASRRDRRTVAAIVAGLLIISTAVVWVVVQSSTHGTASDIHINSRSAALSATAPPTTRAAESGEAEPGPVVAAIGDSIMDGHNVKSSHAWPQLIGAATNWQLTDLAADGSGFVAVGDDGGTFQDQAVAAVGLNPSIIIIAASSNDLGEDADEVADSTMATMTYLRDELPNARIIALNAFWGDTTPPDELADLDTDIRAASEAIDADYLDIGQPLAGQPGLMQFDDIHPTARGLTVIAAAVASAIRADD
ncbi:SGNH/GDSL hydrolase family protein [Agreia sp. COWG]|uniref:SGNH/GDSL hydrolase family protein n=1 Tax=Agreia sp. COWG TaxID=2773266 RepID=UPI001926A2C5|nr:SGNH/GDSL hydrolase family protein [Agreia sp. COWG]CAD6003080.1 Lysophospholipase L1 [Agreia sp. COWG]